MIPSLFKSTSTYGKGLQPTGQPDEYFIKVYTGGFAGKITAMEKAKKIIAPFMEEKGYINYKVLASKFNWFPSYYKFTIQFEK